MNEQFNKSEVTDYLYHLVTKDSSEYTNLIDIGNNNSRISINKLRECLEEIVEDLIMSELDSDYEFEDQVYEMIMYNEDLKDSLDDLNRSLQ